MFKVGDKAKGFKFDGIVDYPLVGWDDEMDYVVGVAGEVSYVGDSTYSVSFEGIPGCWAYPTDLWYLGKVEETTVSDKASFNIGEDVSFKVGDKVKFKKSSLATGMIDAKEDDVFVVKSYHKEHWGDLVKLFGIISTVNVSHLEHVEGEIMQEQKINWEIGQEVWDCAYGKGIVESVSFIDDEIHVGFNRFDNSFNYDVNGIVYGGTSRTLFFSEPIVTAELFPPKKPFVPTLKKGDVVLATKFGYDAQCITVWVEKETETEVLANRSYSKKEYKFSRIGEEIIFN